MVEFQNFCEGFRIWTLFAVVGGLIGTVLFIYGYPNRIRLKILGVILFGHMFLCGLVFILLYRVFSAQAKMEFLKLLNDPNINLTVCNQPTGGEIGSGIISELKLLSDIPRHHSQPLDTLPIKILRNDKNIGIRIQRDSHRQNEYWIFWEVYKITSENAIGYLQTSKFDTLNCR